MEWGTFITVIVAVYLVWYGFNFLIDLFVGGKPKVQTQPGVQYNVKDLLAEEEPAQVISGQDYDQPLVTAKPVSDTPTSDASNVGGTAQKVAAPLPAPAPLPAATVSEIPASIPEEDWASIIDQEEEIIDIQVQGQPISVTDFIQSFKNEAKVQAASIFN